MQPDSSRAASPSVQAGALAALLPHLTAEMHRVNALLDAGQQRAALDGFFALAALAIRTQRDDIDCKGYVLPGRTTTLSVCRIPAQPRPGKPIALFLPGLLAALPLAAARALAFIEQFDIVLCELPGHGASGEPDAVSLASFASEYAALLDTALPRARGLAVIGESLGGLVGLALARCRPDRIRTVILVDTPFQLTRPALAAWIGQAWRSSGTRPYIRRICRDIMGFDPAEPGPLRAMSLHHLVRDAAFDCVHIVGGDQPASGIGSAVTDADIAALRAENPAMLTPPRIGGSGHAVLLDNPAGACAALHACIAGRAAAVPAAR